MSRRIDALRVGATVTTVTTALIAGSGEGNAAGPRITPKKDGRTSQTLRRAEQLPIETTIVPFTNLNAEASHIAGIVDLSPTSTAEYLEVARGAMGPDGALHFKTLNREQLPLNEIGIAISPVDSSLEVLMGDDFTRVPRQGQGGWTIDLSRNISYVVVRNGVAEKPVLIEDKTDHQVTDATFTPDGRYVVAKTINAAEFSPSGYRILNVATGAVLRSDLSSAGPFETELRQIDADTYVGYGSATASVGQAPKGTASRNAQGGASSDSLYGKFTIDAKNGNVSYQALSLPDDISSYITHPYPMKQFKGSDGRDKLWLWGADTRRNDAATLIEIDIDSNTSKVIDLNSNLYANDYVSFSGLAAKDTIDGLNFLSVYESSTDPTSSSANHIEWHQDKFADQSWTHKLVPEDGDWAQIAESDIAGMFVYESNGDRYLVAWSYESGAITRKITNGINSENPWKLAKNKTIAEEVFLAVNYGRKAQADSAYSSSELSRTPFSHPVYEAKK